MSSTISNEVVDSETERAVDEILLVTRVRTLNKGNQALSSAWLAMLQRAFPGAAVRIIERRPRHLLQYTLRRLAAERDPVAAFDALTTALARLAPGPEVGGAVRGRQEILLDETIRPPQRLAALRQRLNLRGILAATGYYREEYRLRLSACQRARLVVVNPAGEFFPREPQAAFYHLVDADVARKLGRPTAIVNHTMDIHDSTLRKIIPYVYRSLQLVGFRDRKSVSAFQEMGGDVANVLVTPDLVLTMRFDREPRRRPGTVAIAINAPEAAANGYLGRWTEVIRGLQGRGLQVELVSNELPADLPYYDQIRRMLGPVAVAGAGLGHEAYCELLSTYELAITSRMHTGILAMVAGTPVVPVEGASFKITGLFEELGLATPVIRPDATDWPTRVIDAATRMRRDGAASSADCARRISQARDGIITTLVPRLQAAAAGTVRS